MRTALWITTLFLVGCGGPEVTRISGSVLVEGTPAVGEKNSVIFWPETDLNLGVMTAFGTGEGGTFTIRPDPKQGGQGKAGAYKVVIYSETGLGQSLANFDGKGHAAVKAVASVKSSVRIPFIYGDDATTPLRSEILPGENDLEPFELIRQKKPRLSP